jgi:ABC-type transport system involved in multi-copper enzyme maturation permease subunit
MWKAIVYKELRENLGLGLLALAVYLFMAAAWIGVKLLPWNGGQEVLVPFVDDGFFLYFGWTAALLAIAIGLRQTLMESVGGTWLLLLHRPMRRGQVIWLKLLTGAGLYLAFSAVPILVYAWWAATPGTHAGPFQWSMTLSTWQLWLSITAVYLGAFLVGMRPARWIGSRLLPLVAAGLFVLLLQVPIPWWWLFGLTALVVLNAVLAGCILFVARTRDFS